MDTSLLIDVGWHRKSGLIRFSCELWVMVPPTGPIDDVTGVAPGHGLMAGLSVVSRLSCLH